MTPPAKRILNRSAAFAAVVLVPLALWAAVPLSSGAASQSQVQSSLDHARTQETSLSSQAALLRPAGRPARGRHRGAPAPAVAGRSRAGGAPRTARPRPRRAGQRAHPPGAAAQAAEVLAPRALAAAGRALRGRPARPDHGHLRVQGLCRPARAPQLPRAHQRSGQAHRRGRAQRPRALGARDAPAGQDRGARADGGRRRAEAVRRAGVDAPGAGGQAGRLRAGARRACQLCTRPARGAKSSSQSCRS